MHTTSNPQSPLSKASSARAKAGKALLVFLALMAALTIAGNTLQEMVIPVVTPVSPQRGALEKQIYAAGTLETTGQVPIVLTDAARVSEILVASGASVQKGQPLLSLDFTDVLKEKHKALMDALRTVSEKRQDHAWAEAAVSEDSLEDLAGKREAWLKAEAEHIQAEAAYEEALAALQTAQEQESSAKSALEEAQSSGDSSSIAETQAAYDTAKKANKDAQSLAKKAERDLNNAQDKLTAAKRDLEKMTRTRQYMTAGKALVSAQENLYRAWRDYFDAAAKLISHQKLSPEEEERLMEEALRAIDFGGTAMALIPFDEKADHTVLVYAPVDGDILTIDAKAGALVSVSAPVMTLNDRSRGLSLTVQVDEDSVGNMAVGASADITVGDDTNSCEITSIAASSTSQGMFDVSFSIPDGFGVVGQRASMKFRKRTQQYDVLISLSALRQDNDGNFVYVVEQREGSLGAQMSVRRADVYVLDQDNARAALQGGVTQRDLIVARSDREIQNGDRVRLEDE